MKTSSMFLATFLLGAVAAAQTPARGAALAAGRGTAGTATPKIEANLLQLMRGILYPSSNVIFAAQDDLAKFPAAADPSTSPNPLTTSYGGWQAVENAGLALAESANLLLIPGRMCSNGKPAPVRRADWVKYSVRFAQPALVNGAVGLVLAPRGRLFRALSFTIERGKIAQVDVIADPARLRQLDLAVLN